MKKLLLFLICAVFFAVSCAKNKSNLFPQSIESIQENFDKHRQQATIDWMFKNPERNKMVLEEEGLEKMTGECDCFYEVVSGILIIF